jgi:hypothetical protein
MSTTTTSPTLLVLSNPPATTDLASSLSASSPAAQNPSGDHEEFLRLLHSNTSLHQAAQTAYDHWARVKNQIDAKEVTSSNDVAALVTLKDGLAAYGKILKYSSFKLWSFLQLHPRFSSDSSCDDGVFQFNASLVQNLERISSNTAIPDHVQTPVEEPTTVCDSDSVFSPLKRPNPTGGSAEALEKFFQGPNPFEKTSEFSYPPKADDALKGSGSGTSATDTHPGHRTFFGDEHTSVTTGALLHAPVHDPKASRSAIDQDEPSAKLVQLSTEEPPSQSVIDPALTAGLDMIVQSMHILADRLDHAEAESAHARAFIQPALEALLSRTASNSALPRSSTTVLQHGEEAAEYSKLQRSSTVTSKPHTANITVETQVGPPAVFVQPLDSTEHRGSTAAPASSSLPTNLPPHLQQLLIQSLLSPTQFSQPKRPLGNPAKMSFPKFKGHREEDVRDWIRRFDIACEATYCSPLGIFPFPAMRTPTSIRPSHNLLYPQLRWIFDFNHNRCSHQYDRGLHNGCAQCRRDHHGPEQ